MPIGTFSLDRPSWFNALKYLRTSMTAKSIYGLTLICVILRRAFAMRAAGSADAVASL